MFSISYTGAYYNFIKFIMFLTNGPTDTSQSYEFTDWSKVDEFAKELG